MFNKYYQDELTYLRDLGREFATAYPAIAPLLAERGDVVARLAQGVRELLVLAHRLGQLPLGLEQPLLEGAHALGRVLEPAPQGEDLVLENLQVPGYLISSGNHHHEGGGSDENRARIKLQEERERERRRPGPASCGRGVEMDSASEGSSSLSEFTGEV